MANISMSKVSSRVPEINISVRSFGLFFVGFWNLSWICDISCDRCATISVLYAASTGHFNRKWALSSFLVWHFGEVPMYYACEVGKCDNKESRSSLVLLASALQIEHHSWIDGRNLESTRTLFWNMICSCGYNNKDEMTNWYKTGTKTSSRLHFKGEYEYGWCKKYPPVVIFYSERQLKNGHLKLSAIHLLFVCT